MRGHLTIRVRLAILCAALVTVSGAVVLIGSLLLTAHVLHDNRVVAPLDGYSTNPDTLRSQTFALLEQAQELEADTIADVRGLGLLGLAGLAIASVGIGWFAAGALLRPATELATMARRISETNLDQRFASDGPPDELKDIADAFDDMLGRLDGAFDRQKRFVADASHEMRTPFAVMRTTVDVALDADDTTPAAMRGTLEQLGTQLDRGADLVNAMLTLSRADVIARREPVDLREVTAEVLTSLPTARELVQGIDLQPALTTGDPTLLVQLVTNLLENAIAYNRPGGRLEVRTQTAADSIVLRVGNDGDPIEPTEVDQLFERFHRHDRRRRSSGGFGIGLAVVDAIVRGHGGEIRATARPAGGLDVEVRLPG